MQIDWDSLNKLDVLFGIASGVVLMFSIVRWTVKRMQQGSFIRFFAWAIIGEDEQTFLNSLKDFAQLALAGVIWSVIGAICGGTFVLVLTLIALGLGSQVSGTTNAIAQYSTFGAIIGAIFRVFVWPIFSLVRNYWQRQRDLYVKKRDDFLKQKWRVESKINRRKDND